MPSAVLGALAPTPPQLAGQEGKPLTVTTNCMFHHADGWALRQCGPGCTLREGRDQGPSVPHWIPSAYHSALHILKVIKGVKLMKKWTSGLS